MTSFITSFEELGWAEGLVEGRAEGLAEGQAQGRRAIVLR